MEQLDPKQVGRTLADMPLGTIIERIAVSIADAQVALDRHAIDVFNMLANDRVNMRTPQGAEISVSPLELGFAPSFYHFDSVTIDIAVEIKIHVEEMMTTLAGGSVGNYTGPGGRAPAGGQGGSSAQTPGAPGSPPKLGGTAGGQVPPVSGREAVPPPQTTPTLPPKPPEAALAKALDDLPPPAPDAGPGPDAEQAQPAKPPADTSAITNLLAGLGESDAEGEASDVTQ